MTSEQIVQAFLEVLKQNPSVFTPEVLPDLSRLKQTLTELQNQPISQAAAAIKTWCRQHPQIRDAVRLFGTREITEILPANPAGEENILINHFPELPQVMQEQIDILESTS